MRKRELARLSRDISAHLAGRVSEGRLSNGTRQLNGLIDQTLAALAQSAATVGGRGKRAHVSKYLSDVYGCVAYFKGKSQLLYFLDYAIRAKGLQVAESSSIFLILIRATAQTDRRNRSKWSRALAYALSCRVPPPDFLAWLRREGGVNRCAAQSRGKTGGVLTLAAVRAAQIEDPDATDPDADGKSDLDWDDESLDWDEEGLGWDDVSVTD